MKTWHVILIIVLCFGCFLFGRHTKSGNTVPKFDTVKIVDTITLPVPDPVYIVDVGEIEMPVPVLISEEGDTIVVHDTLYVPVPIQRKAYETEDYRIVISGFRPSLDTATIYHKKEIIYIHDRRWGIGAIGGYGIGKSGFSPYIGVGLFYRIW